MPRTIDFEHKRVSDLIPADYNPRDISETALQGLRNSVERFGLVEPIVWNKRTGKVVGGHQRLKVLQQMGELETQVAVVDLNETEEKALNVALN
ncbi:MAG: ParB-like chromosome segregation protein Spo0J, partial [Mariniblastus sp.]